MTIATSTHLSETLSSLDIPLRMILPSSAERERESTSTVGGDYALPSLAEEDDKEAKAWADLARRSRERWARENPY